MRTNLKIRKIGEAVDIESLLQAHHHLLNLSIERLVHDEFFERHSLDV
jgi:hypothetical protein